MESKEMKLLLFENAVKRFEDYEQAIRGNNYNIPPEDLLQYQHDCLNFIINMILQEYSDPYSNALFSIRHDLLKQIQRTESLQNQITINDLTITRTSDPNADPFNPSTSKSPSTGELNCEPEYKKIKSSDNWENIVNILSKAKPNKSSGNFQTEKIRSIIENTLVVPQCKGLAEIAGLEESKNLLQEAIMFPIQYPHLFNDGRKKWNKALLYGPPGTGKTQLVHCLAAEIKTRLHCVSNSDLLSSLVGESEKLIKMLFQHCRETKEQCLIFIDEIDSICRARNNRESDHERSFKNELLTQLSEMDRNPNNTIFFLACTNLPWELDQAFIRRFQRRIYIPLPDRAARLQIFKIQLKVANLLNPEQLDHIVDQTDGWSGSDITDLINFAMLQPMKELRTADQWIITDDHYYMPVKNSKHSTLRLNISEIPPNQITVRPVELIDFFAGLQNISKTVSEESLKKFEEFHQSF